MSISTSGNTRRNSRPDHAAAPARRSIPVREAIHTERLTKRYGETVALGALDLAVREGEVYGYLGPNGAGKTTTIRLLLGLHRPTAGRATLFGIDAWADPVAARRRALPLAVDDGG
jgi:ABC-type multidrug transport system ATPase subunit